MLIKLFQLLYISFGSIILFFLAINALTFIRFTPKFRLFPFKIKKFYHNSYLFNIYIIAIPLILLLYLITALAHLYSSNLEVFILASIALLVPSFFGYKKAANVGEWCGILGNYIGFLIYSLIAGGWDFWFRHVYIFFPLNILGQFAGWAGSWAIRGQIHASTIISAYKLKTSKLYNQIAAKKFICQSLIKSYRENNLNSVNFKDYSKDFIILSSSSRNIEKNVNKYRYSSLINYKSEFLLFSRSSPAINIIKNCISNRIYKIFSDFDINSYEQLYAAMSNFYRSICTKVVITTEYSENHDDMLIFISTYSQTPTITWNNKTSDSIGQTINRKIKNLDNSIEDLKIMPIFKEPIIWFKNYSIPPLEVNLMQTFPTDYDNDKVIDSEPSKYYLNLIRNYIEHRTVFDRLRGKALMLGVIINELIVAFVTSKVVNIINI